MNAETWARLIQLKKLESPSVRGVASVPGMKVHPVGVPTGGASKVGVRMNAPALGNGNRYGWMVPAERYLRRGSPKSRMRFVAATSSRVIPGSWDEWPASSTTANDDSGHAQCKSKADLTGHMMS